MSPRREKIALGTILTIVGMLAGAFLSWSATERRLSIHIATADDRVVMMCELADYGAASDEYRNDVAELQCLAGSLACPPKPVRPPNLRREVLERRCR
jgi:hypothetical protein